MAERALLLGFISDTRPPAPVVKLRLVPKPERPFCYSADTRLDMERQDREWLRSARPTDSDWERGHIVSTERTRNG